MMNKIPFCFFLILILIQACNNRQNTPFSVAEQPQVSVPSSDSLIAGYLQLFLNPDINEKTSGEKIKLNFNQAVYEFYAQRNFLPVWSNETGLNAIADTALSLISDAAQYGLSPEYYGFTRLKTIAQFLHQNKKNDELYYSEQVRLDVLLTDALMLFVRHLHKGRLHPETLQPDLSTSDFAINLSEMLRQVIESENFKEQLLSYQPNSKTYHWFQLAFAKFLKTYSPDSAVISIPNPKKETERYYETIRKILTTNGYLSTFPDSFKVNRITEAIKRFRYAHGLEQDGRVGKNTIRALSMSKTDRYRQLIINLERLRWEKEFADEYVFINIPSYRLQVIREDEIIRTHRVIVGTPENPTPVLNSKINYFIVSPEWYVPFSIATKEILPHLKEDSAYLENNKYSLFDKYSNLVDAKSIDWRKVSERNFNYFIRQLAGDENALGVIKFIFPNPYSVYLHDTPSKQLFRKDVRAFSHGCIRLQDPLLFAEFLLKRDSSDIPTDSIQASITTGVKKQINLKHPLPISIRYFTCMADSETLFFYQDIYKKDEDLMKAFFAE